MPKGRRSVLGVVHHIGIACRDVDQVRDRLMTTLDVVRVDGPVRDPLQDADLCMLTLRDGSCIELVAGPPVAAAVARGGGAYHVCFAVERIDDALEALEADGWRVVSPPTPAILFDGAPVAFLLSPLGLVELVELAE